MPTVFLHKDLNPASFTALINTRLYSLLQFLSGPSGESSLPSFLHRRHISDPIRSAENYRDQFTLHLQFSSFQSAGGLNKGGRHIWCVGKSTTAYIWNDNEGFQCCKKMLPPAANLPGQKTYIKHVTLCR